VNENGGQKLKYTRDFLLNTQHPWTTYFSTYRS